MGNCFEPTDSGAKKATNTSTVVTADTDNTSPSPIVKKKKVPDL